MFRLSYFLLFVFAAFAGIAHAAQPTFPALIGRVVDDAHLLDPAATSAIEAKLAALEVKTGRQLVVVTLPSLQGYEIEDYGYQLGRAWGIGQKGSNNGALLIVAPNEHKVRIEVGYGLEGTLTDAVSRLIIENTILPRFRVNDFAGGIQRGVDDIVQVLTGDAADFQRRANDQTGAQIGGEDIGQFIFIAFLLVLFFFALLGPRRRGGAMPWIIPMGGGWSSPGWGGGGGFGGGGFSGGGGSFGGGGASGRW